MIKQCIKDTAMIAFGLVMLYVFVSIAFYGGYTAYEPNRAILAIEIVTGAILLGGGIYYLIDDLKGGN